MFRTLLYTKLDKNKLVYKTYICIYIYIYILDLQYYLFLTEDRGHMISDPGMTLIYFKCDPGYLKLSISRK